MVGDKDRLTAVVRLGLHVIEVRSGPYLLVGFKGFRV